MKPRGFIRGTIAGMLMGLGFVMQTWVTSSSRAAETATPVANAILAMDGNVAGESAMIADDYRITIPLEDIRDSRAVWQLNRLTVQ
jgi:hypothetical protein